MGRFEGIVAIAALIVASFALRLVARRRPRRRVAGAADVVASFRRNRRVTVVALLVMPLAAAHLVLVSAYVSADTLLGVPITWHALAGFVALVGAVITANLAYACPQCGRMPLSERAGVFMAPARCPECGVELQRASTAGEAPRRSGRVDPVADGDIGADLAQVSEPGHEEELRREAAGGTRDVA